MKQLFVFPVLHTYQFMHISNRRERGKRGRNLPFADLPPEFSPGQGLYHLIIISDSQSVNE